MKNKKQILITLVFISIVLFIKTFFLKQSSEVQKNDDFLFLKLFSNVDSSNNSLKSNIQEYKFKIDSKKIDYKSIELNQTINEKTNVYEKIAPGTNGSFDILLSSNHNLKYKLEFDSINEKPKNLKFKAFNNEILLKESNTLEQLSNELAGYIMKDEKIKITIFWYWNFENQEDDKTDIQDTKDAGNIRKYQFNISAIGEEIE